MHIIDWIFVFTPLLIVFGIGALPPGGTRDIFRLFKHLKAEIVNEVDDGTVVGQQNLDEAVVIYELDGATRHEDRKEQQVPSRY